MIRSRRGMTLVDLTIAAVIASIVGVGTMSAFVLAARAQRRAGGPQQAEATVLAQQLMEGMRNLVSSDEDASSIVGDPSLGSKAINQWYADSTAHPGLALAAPGSSESILNGGARRCYRVVGVVPAGCTQECGYQVQVKLCWGDMTGCPCP